MDVDDTDRATSPVVRANARGERHTANMVDHDHGAGYSRLAFEAGGTRAACSRQSNTAGRRRGAGKDGGGAGGARRSGATRRDLRATVAEEGSLRLEQRHAPVDHAVLE